MQQIILEFDNRSELEKIYARLWNKDGLTGETEIRPLGNGRWVMEIHAEKPLKESLLAKLNVRVVKRS